MRIIAGTYRSRILKSLKGQALRPTSDRLRETLFNVLGRAAGGSRFIDVFAGTGAVGIEALSRGASEVVFIENHAPAAALIRRNVLVSDALRGLEKLAARHRPGQQGYDFVFVDPPYAAAEEYAQILRFLGAASFLSRPARVVVEHRRNFELPESSGSLRRARVLRQGDATLTFYSLESCT
jgi:16S rRNA (guanine(966)-N(2))-methyltransferase RsmD